MLKERIRALLPESVLNSYHLTLAYLAALCYGFPSNSLIVIGVTGTSGKSSTTQFLGRLLESAGHKVGWATTVDFKVGDREWVNDKKMTMLGRFQTQRLLREMVRAGCAYAIVETSSQGIAQFRHVAINYDVAVFTNLTPEHIESHGGFENYKQAKGKLFAHTKQCAEKSYPHAMRKMAIVNTDDEHAAYFLSFRLPHQVGFGFRATDASLPLQASYHAENEQNTPNGTTFSVEGYPFTLHPLGHFQVLNALAAIATAHELGVSWGTLHEGVAKLAPVPGRLESIEEGQPFSVIVDYAFTPAAFTAVYETIALFKPKRLIHVTGSAGGGRDVARRAILGTMAAEHADIVIITNEDPYDDDPWEIINNVADAAKAAGKQDGVNLFRMLDREEAIQKAVDLAGPGDLVLITGKGSEPVMVVANGKKVPCDDRVSAHRALKH